MRYIKLYLEFVKQNFKVMLEYRADFLIGFFSTFLLQVGGIFFIWVIFDNIGDIQGWTFYEVTLIYGMLTLAKSINHIFFDNLWVLGQQYVRQGKFDVLLLRPISPLFHLVADKIQQDGFGNLVIGIILVTKSVMELGIGFTVLDFFMMLIFVISGGFIFAAINLITTTTSFWFVESNMFMWSTFSLSEFALYPLGIYHKAIGILLTWLIPYAFASYYPAGFFLDKGPIMMSLLTPVIAVVLWLIALRVWNFGIRNYSSTGS
ncbi:ABC-2 family transporter protein [Cytobacillus suaedae]|nr:ABC-2 family transporter protein [Cytobacillus suaedae]